MQLIPSTALSIATTLIASFLLSACSSGEVDNGLDSEVMKKMSKVETCRETFRLMGKANDVFMNNLDSLNFNFSELAIEFSSLSNKTVDEALRASLTLISDSLKKMSNESTFFEGNSMYLGEIPRLTQECS